MYADDSFFTTDTVCNHCHRKSYCVDMLVPIVDKPLCNLLFQAAFVDHPLVITTMKVLKRIPSAQYASVMSTNHNR